MAANLIRTYTSDEAHHLLNLSFAQYQADRDVVRLEARLERRRGRVGRSAWAGRSDYGDIEEYRRLRDQQHDRDASGRDERRRAVADALAALRPGAVVHVSKGTYRGAAAVVATANRKGGLRAHADHEVGQEHPCDGRGLRRAAVAGRQRWRCLRTVPRTARSTATTSRVGCAGSS